MATKKRTVSVRLDDQTKLRVDKAAAVLGQSVGAFLGKAGEERSRQVLSAWAVERHGRGEASFSELAQETGLAIEEIMGAVGSSGQDDALETFLASCRTVAKMRGDPEFLRLGEDAVKSLRAMGPSTAVS